MTTFDTLKPEVKACIRELESNIGGHSLALFATFMAINPNHDAIVENLKAAIANKTPLSSEATLGLNQWRAGLNTLYSDDVLTSNEKFVSFLRTDPILLQVINKVSDAASGICDKGIGYQLNRLGLGFWRPYNDAPSLHNEHALQKPDNIPAEIAHAFHSVMNRIGL